jgi:phenylpropionate dioxygenase-like ring-hydroxylating dioxygenase large terminal subunit
VLWRPGGAKGAEGWSCLEDRCPHRLAPLSEGRVEPKTGNLMCSYHGYESARAPGRAPPAPLPPRLARRAAPPALPPPPPPEPHPPLSPALPPNLLTPRWEFDAGGSCTAIPQIGDERARAAATGSRRACVTSYPVKARPGGGGG